MFKSISNSLIRSCHPWIEKTALVPLPNGETLSVSQFDRQTETLTFDSQGNRKGYAERWNSLKELDEYYEKHMKAALL